MNHPKCKECRHFNPDMDDWDNPLGLGTCKMMAEKWEMSDWDDNRNNSIKPFFAGHMAAVGDGSEYKAKFYVSPEFYCAMHSAVAPDLRPYSDYWATKVQEDF